MQWTEKLVGPYEHKTSQLANCEYSSSDPSFYRGHTVIADLLGLRPMVVSQHFASCIITSISNRASSFKIHQKKPLKWHESRHARHLLGYGELELPFLCS